MGETAGKTWKEVILLPYGTFPVECTLTDAGVVITPIGDPRGVSFVGETREEALNKLCAYLDERQKTSG